MAEVQLPFTDAELNAEMPKVVRAMNDYIEGFCVPIVSVTMIMVRPGARDHF
jgi:hypothetical protein